MMALFLVWLLARWVFAASCGGEGMAIYEMRTYQVQVGKLAAVVDLYKAHGWSALAKHPPRLVAYFTCEGGR